MRKARKHCTAEEKVAIRRRHLVDKEPVSKFCDELAPQPTVETRDRPALFKKLGAERRAPRTDRPLTPGSAGARSNATGPLLPVEIGRPLKREGKPRKRRLAKSLR